MTSMKVNKVSLENARMRLGDYVNAAAFTGAITIITRNGRPAARIVPLENAMSMVTRDDITQFVVTSLDGAEGFDVEGIVDELTSTYSLTGPNPESLLEPPRGLPEDDVDVLELTDRVVPAEDYWAIVEKYAVESCPEQAPA